MHACNNENDQEDNEIFLAIYFPFLFVKMHVILILRSSIIFWNHYHC